MAKMNKFSFQKLKNINNESEQWRIVSKLVWTLRLRIIVVTWFQVGVTPQYELLYIYPYINSLAHFYRQAQLLQANNLEFLQALFSIYPQNDLRQMNNQNTIQKDFQQQLGFPSMAQTPNMVDILKIFQGVNPYFQQMPTLQFPQQPISFNQKKQNNADNPICVEDDEPQQQQRKCYNSLCKNTGDKKVKSKKNDYIYFCDKCAKLYNKGNFCDYCEQVYGLYDDEAGWIQCDQCNKWNHIVCEQKYRNSNIQNETESNPYHCLNCTKVIKKVKPQKKIEEPPVYRPRNTIEQEDFRNREKNITFVATKDNKVQFTFRLNLLEDEIKSDLESLRNFNKKAKKPQQLSSSPQMQPTQSQQQMIQEPAEYTNQNRNLRRRQNQKVNYRDLVGEY